MGISSENSFILMKNIVFLMVFTSNSNSRTAKARNQKSSKGQLIRKFNLNFISQRTEWTGGRGLYRLQITLILSRASNTLIPVDHRCSQSDSNHQPHDKQSAVGTRLRAWHILNSITRKYFASLTKKFWTHKNPNRFLLVLCWFCVGSVLVLY